MPVLRNFPFNLELGDIVVATVKSINAIGESLPSTENSSGAFIRTEPLKPDNVVIRND